MSFALGFVFFNGLSLSSTRRCIISGLFYENASIRAEAASSRDVQRHAGQNNVSSSPVYFNGAFTEFKSHSHLLSYRQVFVWPQ